jgi:hypothetical protein
MGLEPHYVTVIHSRAMAALRKTLRGERDGRTATHRERNSTSVRLKPLPVLAARRFALWQRV